MDSKGGKVALIARIHVSSPLSAAGASVSASLSGAVSCASAWVPASADVSASGVWFADPHAVRERVIIAASNTAVFLFIIRILLVFFLCDQLKMRVGRVGSGAGAKMHTYKSFCQADTRGPGVYDRNHKPGGQFLCQS